MSSWHCLRFLVRLAGSIQQYTIVITPFNWRSPYTFEAVYFYRTTLCWRVSVMAWRLSVCHKMTADVLIETAKLIELVFGSSAPWVHHTLCYIKSCLNIARNKGTSLWNLVPNFELSRFFCFFATACRPTQVLVTHRPSQAVHLCYMSTNTQSVMRFLSDCHHLPLTCNMTILLLTGLVLMVHRYCPLSSHLMSSICRFHSLTCGRTTVNRKSSTTRRSSYVSGIDLWSSHATCVCDNRNLLILFFYGVDWKYRTLKWRTKLQDMKVQHMKMEDM